MFRSLDPSTSPTRYFPNLQDLIAGNVSDWEVLLSVSRSMDFRVTVRDNASGGDAMTMMTSLSMSTVTRAIPCFNQTIRVSPGMPLRSKI